MARPFVYTSNGRASQDAESAVSQSDAHGIDVLGCFDFLESEARMTGIVPEEAVCPARLLADLFRQCGECSLK